MRPEAYYSTLKSRHPSQSKRSRFSLRALAITGAASGLTLLLAGCGPKVEPEPTGPFEPSPERGKTLVIRYGCRACHLIPEIPGRDVRIGPSLEAFAQRKVIGGKLDNTPENIVRWIRNPRSINPQTAMPTLGVKEREAEDIAAYLQTIQ